MTFILRHASSASLSALLFGGALLAFAAPAPAMAQHGHRHGGESPATPPAATPEPPAAVVDLPAVRAMMDDARYEDAIAAARRYLEQPGLRARDFDACLELLATSQLAVRDTRGATETLGTLYGRDPGHRLADQDPSPVVQAAFARARAAPHTTPTVTMSPVADYGPTGFTVVVHTETGAQLVDDIRLSYRVHGETGFVQVVMPIAADGSARARTPRDDSIAGEYVVEYYVEAFAPSQTLLTSVGSAGVPLTLTVPARAVALAVPNTTGLGGNGGGAPARSGGGSVLEEWWFWTVVAVVAAGLGVGAYFLFGPPSQAPPDGDLGGVTLH